MKNEHEGVLLEVREALCKATGECFLDSEYWHEFTAALNHLDVLINDLPSGLEVGLMNAVAPSDETEERGEWALWCGDEHNAQAVLDAAKLMFTATKEKTK